MAFVLRSIHRLLHAAQYRHIDRVLRRLLLDTGDHPLDLKATFQAIAFNSQRPHEARQAMQLARRRRWMNPPQEQPLVIRELFGNGLIGDQHELLNQLVAFGLP